MFLKNLRLELVIALLIVMIFSSVVLFAECDMMAMLTKSGSIMPDIPDGDNDFDSPEELFLFLKMFSGWQDDQNDDGYGIIYYKNEETIVPESQRFHQVGFNTYYQTNPQQMDDAENTIMNPNNEAVIVLGHDRKTSQGAYGNHPFWFEVYDNNGLINQTYTFQHNGDCSGLREGMRNYLVAKYGSQWFYDHPSNWGASYNNYSEWIDSELLFHFIMSHILDYDGDVVGGIISALNYNGEYGNFASYFHNNSNTYKINFVLSDGNSVYAFRNYIGYNLSYKCFNDEFVVVKTDTVIPDGQNIDQFSLIKIPRNGEIISYEDIFDLDAKLFTSGVIWTSYPRLIQQGVYQNEIYEQAYYANAEEGLLQLTSNGIPTINDFDIIYGHRNGIDIEIDYDNGEFIDDNFDNMLFRHEGYKIEVTAGADPTVLIVDGDRLAEYTIDMPSSENFWLSYYIPYSQNIEDAFGEEFENVNRVWAEDWYYDARYIQRDGNIGQLPSSSTKGKSMEYGKMYIVQMYRDVEDFSWHESETSKDPVKKKKAESFTFTEKANYEVIDVISIPSEVTEIGV